MNVIASLYRHLALRMALRKAVETINEAPVGSSPFDPSMALLMRARADRDGIVTPEALDLIERELGVERSVFNERLWGLNDAAIAEPAWEELLDCDGVEGERTYLGWRLLSPRDERLRRLDVAPFRDWVSTRRRRTVATPSKTRQGYSRKPAGCALKGSRPAGTPAKAGELS